jgi:hypothetical protein
MCKKIPFEYPILADTQKLEFSYDARGRGFLRLLTEGGIVVSLHCRTGSINAVGALVNAIPRGEWIILDKPMATSEPGMRIHDGNGLKVRLYQSENCTAKYTHYLIHYDEKGDGTKGCIGITDPDSTIDFMWKIYKLLDKQKSIILTVV